MVLEGAQLQIPFEVTFWFTVFPIVAIALLVAALINLWRTRTRMSGSAFVAWFVGILLVPWLGPVLWLTIGRWLDVGRSSAGQVEGEISTGSVRPTA
jgi:hypothetical protein